MIIGYKAFGFGLLELQKSDEHEHAPPEPWIKQRLSWITVHDRTTPLSNFGDLGWDREIKAKLISILGSYSSNKMFDYLREPAFKTSFFMRLARDPKDGERSVEMVALGHWYRIIKIIAIFR